MQDILDQYLIDKDFQGETAGSDEVEAAVFFLKMKADYYRYLCEITKDEEDKSLQKSGFLITWTVAIFCYTAISYLFHWALHHQVQGRGCSMCTCVVCFCAPLAL